MAELKLKEERETAELREQFIAILGHDLRSPVTAITNAAQILLRMTLDEKMKRLAEILHEASFRMKVLIENVLDFARGRLGEGIILDRRDCYALPQTLQHVIDELRLVFPGRAIQTSMELTGPVNCDEGRLAQLFSNLLGNALTHGSAQGIVEVSLAKRDKSTVLSVCNDGEPIPENQMERLFHPFSRGEIKPGQQGLGLGLYIASEIAKAHGGTLEVVSNATETCFTYSFQ